MLEGEYKKLRELIDPLIQVVSAGYTDNGAEEKAFFTETASSAMTMISQITDEFEFTYGLGSYDPANIFGEEIINSSDVGERELKKVVVDDVLLLDHSYTDIDLRCLVAKEIERSFEPVNDECLYAFVESLRDACEENYDAESRAMAE